MSIHMPGLPVPQYTTLRNAPHLFCGFMLLMPLRIPSTIKKLQLQEVRAFMPILFISGLRHRTCSDLNILRSIPLFSRVVPKIEARTSPTSRRSQAYISLHSRHHARYMSLFLRVRVVNNDVQKPSICFPPSTSAWVCTSGTRWEPAEEVNAAVYPLHAKLGYKWEEQATRSQQHEENEFSIIGVPEKKLMFGMKSCTPKLPRNLYSDAIPLDSQQPTAVYYKCMM